MALASESLNENGQLPIVDALLDQMEGKFCLSYKINSIFSGSCAQNNSYSAAPAGFYFTANFVFHFSTDSPVIADVHSGKGTGSPAHVSVREVEEWGDTEIPG